MSNIPIWMSMYYSVPFVDIQKKYKQHLWDQIGLERRKKTEREKQEWRRKKEEGSRRWANRRILCINFHTVGNQWVRGLLYHLMHQFPHVSKSVSKRLDISTSCIIIMSQFHVRCHKKYRPGRKGQQRCKRDFGPVKEYDDKRKEKYLRELARHYQEWDTDLRT